MPNLAQALNILELLLGVALLVGIFLAVNKVALAAADARNRRRR